MRQKVEKPVLSGSSFKPMTINLQTRPFSAVETQNSSSSELQNAPRPYDSSYSDEIMRKLLNAPMDVVQRKPRDRFAKFRAQNGIAPMPISIPIQAKLNIGEPNDRYEQEADHTAAQVVQQINSPMQDQPDQKQGATDEEEEKLQMKSAVESREHIGGVVQRSPLQNVVQRDDDGSVVGGYGGDSIEGGGNFMEFLDDAYNAIKTVKDPSSGKVKKGIAGGKALGSLTGTVLAGLKANEIQKMTSCLGAMSEGLKIFDAGKEIWESVRKVDFWNDTTMQTFENVALVVSKLGDFIVGSAKIAEGFVKAMEWATGKLSAFADWLPISELIMKGVKFITAVKKWIFAFTSYKKLKVLQGTIDPSKQQQVGYLVDEQWSRLKNGAVPFASTGVDFASETGKYFPSLGINTAIVASLGTASKAVPLGHKILTTGYDYVRQGWRKMVKSYASTNVAGYLAAIDKADLDSFRDGLATFVFNERNHPHGMLILESLGLGASVQTMADPEAKNAIDEAVQDIK